MMNKTPSYKCSSVMLIDDNSIDNFINERLIKLCHFSETINVHTSVMSGLEYLESTNRIIKSSKPIVPEYIFLDINLPIIDGWRFLKQYEEMNLDCKIIVLTNSLSSEDMDLAFSYKSVVGFLSKPLMENDLKNLS